MSELNNKKLLFKWHDCSNGLSDQAVDEICDAAELINIESGEFLHHANDVITSVFLVVKGRLKQSIVNMHGEVMLQRFMTRGAQFGALGAAQAEPVPMDVVAVEPSVVLKLDYETALKLTQKHELFGINISRSIASMVRDVLLPDRKPKKSSLIIIFHESSESRSLTTRLIQRFLELGETPCVMSDQTDWEKIEGCPYRSLLNNREHLTREEVRQQIHEWSDSGRIIVDIDAALDPEKAKLFVGFSDQVIWCTQRENVETTIRHLKTIETQEAGWKEKINLVWLMGNNFWVAPRSSELYGLVERTFHITTAKPQPNQSRTLLDGFERLVHQLRGIRIGLALGGGGARGMAHLGVLKALEQHGIVIDMIAGTSAGAMAGILYAAGLDADYTAERFVIDLKPSWFYRLIPRGNHWYLFVKYRRGHFDRMLRKYLNEWTLEQLPVPVRSVTVDLVTGRPVVREQGDAVNSILESINLPVFSNPIVREGQALVDGGLVNNIPADVLVRQGCNFVIAVSVTAKLELEFAHNRPDTPTAEMSKASLLQTIMRSFMVQSVNMHSIGVQPADVVIEPDATGVDLSEFSRTQELAAIGEQATIEVIPHLKELLSKLDNQLFPAA